MKRSAKYIRAIDWVLGAIPNDLSPDEILGVLDDAKGAVAAGLFYGMEMAKIREKFQEAMKSELSDRRERKRREGVVADAIKKENANRPH